ncbi:Methyltransferase domain-containing protein [Desulfatibacillum alkenivorans DSM 16219]|jgi:SAM-dependent methyltransferase|uniref:Methyltransferase domain-containing protein n=1 Tax=Desulfatibacillum alkenivorans DSM 16219 TaxID=1121393 RepID=A0A1M6EJY5_9BACT|nr:Methyltransferase domain-containing protein [Desulfatibacillum alkenivorans DSM 16219]
MDKALKNTLTNNPDARAPAQPLDDGTRVLMRLAKADRFNTWMADAIRPFVGEKVLEIGSGIGSLTKKLLPRQSYTCTDINPFHLEITRRLTENRPYLEVSYLDLNDISQFTKARRSFDTVVCINVIEHLEDDLGAVNNISSLLEPGGRAVILVPRGQAFFGTLDELVGHKRRYSKDMLVGLARKTGLTVERIIPYNRVSTVFWVLNGQVLKKRSFGGFQVYMMNLLTPLFRRVDRFIPSPSLSYLAVFRK